MSSSLNYGRSNEIIQCLTSHAAHLDSISHPAIPEDVFYDMMSGALVWRDETNEMTPIQVIWALRAVVAYRTSLMLNEPQTEFREIWDIASTLFPNWVGFYPDRRRPSPRLLDIYRHGDINLSKCLRDIEQEYNDQAASEADK